MSTRGIAAVVLTIAVAFGAGCSSSDSKPGSGGGTGTEKTTEYGCPTHGGHATKPGKCPVCGADMVPHK
ncbi:hypothetical protein HY251_00810 [bacterium]|nr:hypothetical protein [bacterium]